MFRRNKGGFNLRRFDAYLYIEREFFCVDQVTFNKIADLYRELYWDGSYRYLINVYDDWKTGRVSRTRSTMERILKCVPRFLSDEKRFFILKNEITSFIYRLHKEQIKKRIHIHEIDEIYWNYIDKIKCFGKNDLPFMVGKRIFTDDEIEWFLEICKYILFEKLRLSYEQVQKDFNLIKYQLSQIRNWTFQAIYKINFLDNSIDISLINIRDYAFQGLNIEKIVPSWRYQKLIENYIFWELLEMNFSETEWNINSLIELWDINFLILQCEEIKKQDKDMVLNSEFQCAWWTLSLRIELKSINNIKLQILFSRIKLILYAIFILWLFYLFYNSWSHKMTPVVFLLFFGEIVLILFLKTEVSNLKDLILTLKIHGK